MKKISIFRILFFLLLLNFKITKAQTQNNSEILGSKVLEALKTNNYNSLEDFLPTIDDFEEWVEKIASYFPEEKQRELVYNKNELAKSTIRELYESFNSVYKEGELAGLNWSKVKFKSISSEYVAENPIPKEMLTGININFTYLGVEYNVAVFAIELNRGYVIGDKFKFY